MKRIVLILMLVLVASVGFGSEVLGEYGGWIVFENEGTLLDPGFTMMALEGIDGSSLGIRVAPTVRVMVVFPDFLASEGERHDQQVVFITDAMEKPMELENRGFRISSSALVWEGPSARELIDEIVKANAMMFRTHSYRSTTVDAVFETSTEDATSALEALEALDE